MKSPRFAALAAACALLGIRSGSAQVPHPPFTSLIEQVAGFDVKRLPAHPRLLLTDANVAQMKAAQATPEGAGEWRRIVAWLDAECALPGPVDPDTLKVGKGATFNIVNFRKIQNLAEDAENHLVVPAAAYRLSGDPRYLALARRWTVAAARWAPNGVTGIKSDDYMARQTLSALALAYDGLFDQWSPEERRLIRTSIAARTAAIYAFQHPFNLDEFNNHPWFQSAGMIDGGLAIADEDAAADKAWRYGAGLFFARYLTLWGQDGDWHEGISYTTFALKYVCQFANSLQSATGIDPFAIPALQKAGYFRLYTAPAGTRGIYFNDTRPLAPQQWDRPIAYRLAKEAHDPVLQWYAESLPVVEGSRPSSALYSLLYRDLALKAAPPSAAQPLTVHWRDSGWVTTRTDLSSSLDVEFGFKATPWIGTPKRAKGHDHPDANNILLNYLGQPLIADSGYYDYYSSPQHKGWTFTGRAHNTLLIDGREQAILRPGKILAVISVPGKSDWMEGEGAAGYPDGLLHSWRRQILYLRPDLFVIRDVVRLARPATVTWLMHGFTPFELKGQSFIGRNGPAAVSGEIVMPQNLTVKQWTGFPADAQPERKKPSDFVEFPDQSHVEFATPGKVNAVTFVTVFGPSPSGRLKRIGATVREEGGVDTVTIHPGDGAPITVTFPSPATDDRASAPAVIAAN